MWWRYPSVLAIGASLFALATAAADAAGTVRLLRVAPDADAVVVRDERAQLHVVRNGERVLESAWSLHAIRAGGATFSYGSVSATGALLVDVRAGESLDLSRGPADLLKSAHPGVVATHVIPIESAKRDAP